MAVPYRNANLGQGADESTLTKALQRDLRSLGYLRQGIDGDFGKGTDHAVRCLQHDLLHSAGPQSAGDGSAPVAIAAFNKGRVAAITGQVDAGLADCIEEMLNASIFPKVPSSPDPKAANEAVLRQLGDNPSRLAPTPIMLAMFQQESGGRHFRVPSGRDADNFVTVGLDFGDKDQPFVISSRGYGLGQYTLFHHPPRPDEVTDFIMDPVRNVTKAHTEFREKFDGFVAGPTSGRQADDRVAEHGKGPLRMCKFGPTDERFLRDCRNCAKEAGKLTITATTAVHAGSDMTYGQQTLYPLPLDGVPNRADFACDWPYAARRYNGSGPLSYNYQAKILRYLLSV